MSFFGKLFRSFMVNPRVKEALYDTAVFRRPAPGSRPLEYERPTSKSSDIANNYYFNRDSRRDFPNPIVYKPSEEQGKLLISSGTKPAVPIPAVNDAILPPTPGKSQHYPLSEVYSTGAIYFSNEESVYIPREFLTENTRHKYVKTVFNDWIKVFDGEPQRKPDRYTPEQRRKLIMKRETGIDSFKFQPVHPYILAQQNKHVEPKKEAAEHQHHH